MTGMTRAGIAVAALAAFMLLAPQAALAGEKSGVGSQAALPQDGTTIGFWAGEAVPGTDWGSPGTYWKRRDTHAYTPYLWRVLRQNQIPLYFNLRYERDFGPVPPGEPHRHDALKVIRRANRLGVPVWAWVLIPYSDGYWAWEGAAAEQLTATKALVSWARRKHVQLRGVALDPEPRVLTPFETAASMLGGGSDATLSALFQQSIDPPGQCAAWRGYARIVHWAKRHGVNIAAAPAPAALDDLKDRRLALQDATGFVLPNAPWDELYFQAYRSVFAYYSGRDPGPGIVSSYLRSARHEFGRAGQVSLGSAGRGPYRRFSSLLNDVRLAATLGAREVPIYSLERTLRSYGGPHALVRLVQAAQRPFAGPAATRSTAPTSRASDLRAAIHRTDIAATLNTPAVTASHGVPLPPNRWPEGCRQDRRALAVPGRPAPPGPALNP
jgi:hypothetical protein